MSPSGKAGALCADNCFYFSVVFQRSYLSPCFLKIGANKTGQTHLKTNVVPAKRNEMECEQPACPASAGGEAGHLYNGSNFLFKDLNISFIIEVPSLSDRQAFLPSRTNNRCEGTTVR